MKSGIGFVFPSLLFITSCGGLTTLSPAAPSSAPAPPTTIVASPVAPVPPPTAGGLPAAQTIHGSVGPLADGGVPCWADRYPCQVYAFSLRQPGPIEVTLTWDGHPLALMVQLYWAGEGLAHEDLAPRTGPSRINFRRPLMEASNYQIRIVSLEPERTTPFELMVTY